MNNTHYFASQTENACESSVRFDVTATVNTTPASPTGTSAQSFCLGASPTVANLSATGTDIKWYEASVNGSDLAGNAALVNNTHYFASQTENGCESSDRFDVTATVNTTPVAPTGTATQSFYSGASPTVANLVATGTDIKWYDASANGILLAGTTALINNTHYYATQTISGCESINMFDVTVIINSPVIVNVKVFLQGAYNAATGLMNTVLREKPYFPTIQPYSVAPWNYNGTESVVSIPLNVVDWVLVELRTNTSAASIIDRKAGFVLADGSVVGKDGVNPLEFPEREYGNYFIVIRHRNHLAVMSADIQSLSSTSVLYDFTLNSNQSYGTPDPVILSSNGYAMMIGGDVNSNGSSRVNGSPGVNDKLILQTYIGINTRNEYSSYDVSLDGIVRANGSPTVNDALKISSFLSTNSYFTRVPN